MRKILSIGLIGALLGLGVATGVAQAQDLPAPAVKSGAPSIDWPIQDLLADPALDAVVVKDLPDLPNSQYLEMIKPMSIRSVAKFPQANIDQAKLDQVQADLTAAAAGEPAGAVATAAVSAPAAPAAAPQ
ncbi:MAG TPA: hypothetical protein VE309_06180 [Caulobacteraceae bacterium]|jgi:hypothetical protein|nr:hypothetical protein [Caulobacteraceae bacterium]